MRKLRIFEHISLDGVIQHSADETPCLLTARTYAILTAPVAGWFSNAR